MDIERQNFLPEIDRLIKNQKYEAFKLKFEETLMKRYGITIGDCTDEETIKVEFETGSTVEEYLEFLADKYDLTNIDPERLFH